MEYAFIFDEQETELLHWALNQVLPDGSPAPMPAEDQALIDLEGRLAAAIAQPVQQFPEKVCDDGSIAVEG